MTKLPRPPERYDARYQEQQSATMEREMNRRHRKDQDVELGRSRLILTSPNGTRYALAVDNSGNLSTVAL